jgi:hypothetical protein
MLHRRQFVLGPRPVLSERGWTALRLEDAGVLSRCPELPLARTRDAEGVEWCLVGLAVQTDPSRPDPTEELRAAGTSAVPALTRSWAGRWLLIGGNRIYPDASALRACFFCQSLEGSWASSSAALLAELMDDKGDLDPRPLGWGKGIEWYPLPGSRFGSVRRLLPSQTLELATGEPHPWSFLSPPDPGLSYARTLDLLQARLLTAIARLPSYARLWLPITSGFDSRLLLGLALTLGLRFRTFTHERPHLSIGDRLVPAQLARMAGVSHRFVRPGQYSAAAEAEYDAHTARQSVDADRGYYAQRQWAFVRPKDIVIHGGCFEVGRCYYYDRLPGAPPGELPSAAEIATWMGEPADSSAAAGLDRWLTHVARHPLNWLDWRDRFYIEQRLAGWLSSLEQSLDLIDAQRFHPANAAETFSLLLAIPRPQRETGEHQRELIRRLTPSLLRLPINPPEDDFNPLARFRWRLRQNPPAAWRSVLRRLGW